MTRKLLILSLLLSGCGNATSGKVNDGQASTAVATAQAQECKSVTGPATLYFHGQDNSSGLPSYNHLTIQSDADIHYLVMGSDSIDLYVNKDHTYDVTLNISAQTAANITSQHNGTFPICGIELSNIAIQSGTSAFSVASARLFNSHGWVNF